MQRFPLPRATSARPIFASVTFVVALLLGLVSPAGAATINVANNTDYNAGTPPVDGDGTGCTFRKALKNALDGAQTFMDCTTGSSGADIIAFNDASTFTMGTLGVFDFITKDITITAPGSKTFDATASNSEIFHVSGATAKLTMNGFTLSNATNSAVFLASGGNLSMNVGAFNNNSGPPAGGGAITGDGTISLTAIHFNGNSAANGNGGAINLNNSSFGSASITDSFFDGNTANNSGGAIYYVGTATVAPGATLTITNTLFGSVLANTAHAANGNTDGGGAIFASAIGLTAQVSIIDSSFVNNVVDGNGGLGGAIYNSTSDTLPMVVDHNVFTLNQVNGDATNAGGAIYAGDSIVVRASSFISNKANAGSGGAIASSASPADPAATPPRLGAVIANSTIQGNSAASGGGVYSFATSGVRDVQLINVTMDSNTASISGGGIFTQQTGAGTVSTTVKNTIVSNNSNGNCTGILVTNVIGNLQFPGGTCSANVPLPIGDPKLNSPSINLPDVLTLTMSLQPNSKASNAGDNATCAAFPILNFDQRSLVVPIRPLGDPNCDAGAYESSNAPVYVSNPVPSSAIVINTVQAVAGNQTVVISEAGTEDLVISSYGVSGTGTAQISVSPPSAPFTIPPGSGQTKTLPLTCVSPVPGTFNVTLTVNHNASGSPATYPVTCNVSGVPDLMIAKSHAGNFFQGETGAQYTITVSNVGNAPTDGSIVTVTEFVPAGFSPTSMNGPGWACTQPAGPCTRSDVLPNGAQYSSITLTGDIPNNAPPSITNNVTVAGGGETNLGNDAAVDFTTVNAGMDLLIVKTHGGNFTQGQVGAQYSIAVTNVGGTPTDGSTVTVFDILPAGLTASAISGPGWVCNLPTTSCTRNDVLAPAASYPVITLTVNVSNVAPSPLVNTATVAGGGVDVNLANNTFNDSTIINPGASDLTIAKSHVGNFTQGQTGAQYTITVSNIGISPTTGTVTVVDTLPVGLTASAVSGTGWACTLATTSCTRSDALASGTSYQPITLTVNVANNASSPLTNTATVSGGGETNLGNDTATDPTTIIALTAELAITKSHVGNFNQGQSGAQYTITVSNVGLGATDGTTVTVVDAVPAGLTASTIIGTGWACTQPSGPCTRSDVLAAGASYPPITLTVNVASNAPASVINTATVSGGGETNAGNDTANDPTTVNPEASDLTIAKTHVGNFSQGQTGAMYTITVSNIGALSTSGTVTVVDAVPAGLTATAMTGTGWACTLATTTCTRSDVLATGLSYPPITLTVNVANGAPGSVINTATVSGGGETNLGNDTASDPTTITAAAPDLTVVKSHVGNFSQGQVGATYTITVTNSGGLATTGTVTVVDTVPAGLTATAISGTGWACTLATATCTRSDALAAGASYPAITLTVTVANNAAANVVNSVTVSGGGETNTANDTATDPTTITSAGPDLTIAKTHVGNFMQAQTGKTYTITVSNVGSTPTSGVVTVTDVVPAGLTATAMNGAGWVCTQPSGPCTRSDPLAAGASYPAITLTVNVANNAPASVINTATVSGGGETNAANDTANDPTTILAAAPDLTITKTHVGNLFQGQVGAVYTITVTNSGTAPTDGTVVTVTDGVPAGLTATAISGSGWTCTQPSGPCTRSDVLPAGSSYPPLLLTVNVASNAPATVTNVGTVVGGGDSNAANNSASDLTTITAPGLPTAAVIPSLSDWGLVVLALLLGAIGAARLSRRGRTR